MAELTTRFTLKKGNSKSITSKSVYYFGDPCHLFEQELNAEKWDEFCECIGDFVYFNNGPFIVTLHNGSEMLVCTTPSDEVLKYYEVTMEGDASASTAGVFSGLLCVVKVFDALDAGLCVPADEPLFVGHGGNVFVDDGNWRGEVYCDVG
jgi:hypothetical protein